MNASPFGCEEIDWLVYADKLEESGEQGLAELVREEISDENPPWNWEYSWRAGGGVGGVGG